jgi:hypothetical protein
MEAMGRGSTVKLVVLNLASARFRPRLDKSGTLRHRMPDVIGDRAAIAAASFYRPCVRKSVATAHPMEWPR